MHRLHFFLPILLAHSFPLCFLPRWIWTPPPAPSPRGTPTAVACWRRPVPRRFAGALAAALFSACHCCSSVEPLASAHLPCGARRSGAPTLHYASPRRAARRVPAARAVQPPAALAVRAARAVQGDIVLYERMSWEAAFSLAGQHTADVSLLAFSPNGAPAFVLLVCQGRLAWVRCRPPASMRQGAELWSLRLRAVPLLGPTPARRTCLIPSLPPLRLPPGLYLASAGADQALCLWDVNERTCLEKRLLPGAATGLAWHPGKNELALITEDGGCWLGLAAHGIGCICGTWQQLHSFVPRGMHTAC